VVQAWTGSYGKLTKDMPTATLFYFPVLLSVIVSSLIQLAFQVFFYLNVRQQPFYVPFDPHNIVFTNSNLTYEGTVLFMIANFQYLITCMSFSIAKPFRKPIWTNLPFFVCVILLFVFNGLCIFLPSDNTIYKYFNLEPFATDVQSYYSYRFWIALGVVINAALTYAAEKFILNVVTVKADKRKKDKKEKAFHEMMTYLKATTPKSRANIVWH